MNRAIFLDRDNTIIQALNDPTDTRSVTLIKGAASAIASLRGLGYRIIVITNQGGVARGEITEEDVEKINQRIHELVKQNSNTRIDRFYYCPYDPGGTVERFAKDHPWRKPNPGMILQAARDFQVDVKQSWTVGDSLHDIQAGIAAGTRTVLLQPGAVVQTPPGVGTSPRSTGGAAGRARRAAANADLAGEPVPGSLHGSELPSPIIMPETTLSAAPAEKTENAAVDSQQIIERAQAIGVDFIAQSLTEAVRLIAQSRRHDISDPAKTAPPGDAPKEEEAATTPLRAARTTGHSPTTAKTGIRTARKPSSPRPPEVPEGPEAPEASDVPESPESTQATHQPADDISAGNTPEAQSELAQSELTEAGSEAEASSEEAASPAPAQDTAGSDASEASTPPQPSPASPGESLAATAATPKPEPGGQHDPDAAAKDVEPSEQIGEMPAQPELIKSADREVAADAVSEQIEASDAPGRRTTEDHHAAPSQINTETKADAPTSDVGDQSPSAGTPKEAADAESEPSDRQESSASKAGEWPGAGVEAASSRSQAAGPDREPDEEEPSSASSSRDEIASAGPGAAPASGRWGRAGTKPGGVRPGRPDGSRHRTPTEATAAAPSASTAGRRSQDEPDEGSGDSDRPALTGIRTRDIPAEQTLREILQELRNQRRTEAAEFGLLDGVALLIQLIAVVCVAAGLMLGVGGEDGLFWRGIGVGIFCQLVVIAILLFKKDR